MHMTEDAKRIIDDSIRAVLPDAAVYRALEGRRFDRPVTVIAIGKAAWRMANAAAKALGMDSTTARARAVARRSRPVFALVFMLAPFCIRAALPPLVAPGRGLFPFKAPVSGPGALHSRTL